MLESKRRRNSSRDEGIKTSFCKTVFAFHTGKHFVANN